MEKENKFRLDFHSSNKKYEMEIENKFRLDFHSSKMKYEMEEENKNKNASALVTLAAQGKNNEFVITQFSSTDLKKSLYFQF